jgi:hypothetical protein
VTIQFNEMISSPCRLAILAALVPGRPVRFSEMKAVAGLSDGNLHVQTHKLADVGYLKISKALQGRRSVTEFRITKLGLEQFELYVRKLQQVLDQGADQTRPVVVARQSDDGMVWS